MVSACLRSIWLMVDASAGLEFGLTAPDSRELLTADFRVLGLGSGLRDVHVNLNDFGCCLTSPHHGPRLGSVAGEGRRLIKFRSRKS